MRALGIDVAGIKKGFHAALAIKGQPAIEKTWSNLSLEHIPAVIRATSPDILALDCPPRAQISGSKTRLAERQINRINGVNPQWTRRPDNPPQEWMLHGQALWELLEADFPQITRIETFPTAAAISLEDCPLLFPVKFCQGDVQHRLGYKDLLDAAICAWVGLKFLDNNVKSVGFDPATGETDELGPIYF